MAVAGHTPRQQGATSRSVESLEADEGQRVDPRQPRVPVHATPWSSFGSVLADMHDRYFFQIIFILLVLAIINIVCYFNGF